MEREEFTSFYAASLRVTPDGKTVYIGTSNDTVIPVNTATNTAGKPIRLGGSFPWEMSIGPDGKTVYIANLPNTVVPISTATNTAGNPIRLGLALKIAIAPDGKTLYVAAHNKIVPISTASSLPGKPIRLPIRVGFPASVIIP